MFWVAVEDVIIPGRRRTAPNMGGVESSLLHEAKILDNDRMIRNSAIAFGLKILHRVQIGNVYAPFVWRRAIVSVLVNIHGKEKSIHPVYSLEESNALRPDGEFAGTIFCSVAFQHLHRER